MMAKKSVLVCDNCGAEMEYGKAATVRVVFSDERKTQTVADYCNTCAEAVPGEQVTRRGRPRAAAVAA